MWLFADSVSQCFHSHHLHAEWVWKWYQIEFSRALLTNRLLTHKNILSLWFLDRFSWNFANREHRRMMPLPTCSFFAHLLHSLGSQLYYLSGIEMVVTSRSQRGLRAESGGRLIITNLGTILQIIIEESHARTLLLLWKCDGLQNILSLKKAQ